MPSIQGGRGFTPLYLLGTNANTRCIRGSIILEKVDIVNPTSMQFSNIHCFEDPMCGTFGPPPFEEA